MTNGLPHKFATVLAADVANYTSLMESSGESTVFNLKRCREDFTGIVTENHGREFGTHGDSFMAEFASPVEALRAARSIQINGHSWRQPTSGSEPLRLRIGLHAGDVLCEGDDLYGDVVNAAARIQELARPGGIAVSEFVHDQVDREPGFAFSKLGKQHLRNIAEPMVVFEVAWQSDRLNLRRLWLIVDRYQPAIIGVIGMLVIGLGLIVYVEHRVTGIGVVIEVPAGPAAGAPNESIAGSSQAVVAGSQAATDEFLIWGAQIGQRAASAPCSAASVIPKSDSIDASAGTAAMRSGPVPRQAFAERCSAG